MQRSWHDEFLLLLVALNIFGVGVVNGSIVDTIISSPSILYPVACSLGVVIILLLIGMVLYCRRNRGGGYGRQTTATGGDDATSTATREGGAGTEKAAKLRLNFSDLQFGTKSVTVGNIQVVNATYTQSNGNERQVMCKVMKPVGTAARKMRVEFRREVEALALLTECKSITRMVGYCEQPKYTIAVKLHASSCRNFLREYKDAIPVIDFACDLVKALKFIHKIDMVHCDFRLESIFLEDLDYAQTNPVTGSISDRRLVLGNFQYATFVNHRHPTLPPQTINYTPPECLDPNTPAKTTRDIYALGIVLWELVTLETPYAKTKPSEVISAVKAGQRPFVPLFSNANTPGETQRNPDVQNLDGITRVENEFGGKAMNALMELVENCWKQQENLRVSSSLALDKLRKIIKMSQPWTVGVSEIRGTPHAREFRTVIAEDGSD